VPEDDFLEAIALARLILPARVHLQAPPNLSDDFGVLLDAGIDDWGGVSPGHRRPREPRAALARARPAREVTEAAGFAWRPGSPSTPSTSSTRALARRGAALRRCSTAATPRGSGATTPARVPERTAAPWYSGAEVVQIGRRSTAWYSGRRWRPPPSRARPRSAAAGGSARCSTACAARPGARRRRDRHAVRRPAARGGRRGRGGRRAAARGVGDVVTCGRNRNINYTNVCTFKCRFCGFSKGPLSLNLRGTPYLLTLDDIAERVREAGSSAPPRSACRAASTPTSTATTTSTSPGR
jgi:FO synthase